MWLRPPVAALVLMAIACPACAATSQGPAPTLLVDETDSLANPPTLEEPDVWNQQGGAADLQTGLDLARVKLKTLDRYRGWQGDKTRYNTTVSYLRGHVIVVFNPPGSTDQEVSIEVDPVAKVVVRVNQGMA